MNILKSSAGPSMLAAISTALCNIIDVLYLSRGVSLMAIAGLAVTFPLITLYNAFSAMINSGGASYAAFAIAKGDQQTVTRTYGIMFHLNIIAGVVLAAITLACHSPILTIFGASGNTMPYASDYITTFALGLPVIFTFNGFLSQLHSKSRPRVALKCQLIAVVLNIILDPLLIFAFGLGVRGAALATILSQTVAWCYIVKECRRYGSFSISAMRLDTQILYEIAHGGATPLMSNICGCLVGILINIDLLETGGDHADKFLGAYCIVQRITQLIIVQGIGFGRTIHQMVAQQIARQQYDSIRHTLMKGIKEISVIMTVGYIGVAVLSPLIARMFSDDPQLEEFCVPALRIGLCTFPFVGSQMIAVAFFQAIHRQRLALIVNLSRQVLFLIPMLVVLPGICGVHGVWWSMALADLYSVTITWIILWFQTKKM